MKKTFSLLAALLLLFYHSFAQQTREETIGVIFDAIKHTNCVMYDYAISVGYPNGQSDQITGQMCMDAASHCNYNSNNYQTIIYSPQYIYRADHVNKTVTVVDGIKHLSKGYKEALEKQMFGGEMLTLYLDSLILRSASIKSFRNSNDTVYLELSFPRDAMVKSISLVFDMSASLMVNYKMTTFRPAATSEFGKGKGFSHHVTCTHFRKPKDLKQYTTGSFFIVNKDKVVLKKYKNYKVQQQI